MLPLTLSYQRTSLASRPMLLALALLSLVISAASCANNGTRKTNVVLLSLDTLRADYVGHWGLPEPATPNLDRFLRNTLVFPETRCPQPHTLPSHAALLTGMHPETLGVTASVRSRSLPQDVPLLAEILRENGYRTAAWINAGFLHPRFGFDRGFETYDFVHDQGSENENRQGRNAEQTSQGAMKWLRSIEEDDEPFFLFAHYFDAHSDWAGLPYSAPMPLLNRFAHDQDMAPDPEEIAALGATTYLVNRNVDGSNVPPEKIEYFKRSYLAGIRYLDHHLEPLLAYLSSDRRRSDTLVILVSDHGEEFREHGMFLHEQAFDETTRVLLAMRLPGNTQGRVIPEPVALLDLLPTTLALLGLESPDSLSGRNLAVPITTGAPIDPTGILIRGRSSFVFLKGNQKLLYQPRSSLFRLFHLEADPGDGQSVASQLPDQTSALFSEMQRAIEAARNHSESIRWGERTELDPQTEENLRALGYVQ